MVAHSGPIPAAMDSGVVSSLPQRQHLPDGRKSALGSSLTVELPSTQNSQAKTMADGASALTGRNVILLNIVPICKYEAVLSGPFNTLTKCIEDDRPRILCFGTSITLKVKRFPVLCDTTVNVARPPSMYFHLSISGSYWEHHPTRASGRSSAPGGRDVNKIGNCCQNCSRR